MSTAANKMLRSLAVLAVSVIGSVIAIGMAVGPAIAPATLA
jgi:hypothetical protein